MLARLSEAFLLGLSMGPACLGYCSPVFLPLVASEKHSGWRGSARTVGLFLLGRLAGYSLIGIAVGILGTLLLHSISATIYGAIRIFMGVVLILFGFMTDAAGLKWCPVQGRISNSRLFSLTLGLLTGLNLCPPFGAAIAGAATSPSIPSALFYFWAFFAGTAVYFAPLALISPLTRMEAFRQIARICLFLAGIWLVLEGILMSLGTNRP
ncbi:MAG: sulfite exporter TauE/SafE family protein [Acidobacteriia bacterium]|nr:sulfite exporter TauE/SafE family protein [Terriglobia bacterium]